METTGSVYPIAFGKLVYLSGFSSSFLLGLSGSLPLYMASVFMGSHHVDTGGTLEDPEFFSKLLRCSHMLSIDFKSYAML